MSVGHRWLHLGIVNGWTAGVKDPEGFWSGGRLGGDIKCLDRDEAAVVGRAEGDAIVAGVQL